MTSHTPRTKRRARSSANAVAPTVKSRPHHTDLTTHPWLVPILSSLPWLLLLGWLTSVTWFLLDDAFITFRYVRNLVEGHGIVFNRGEYVEGYTNFLWLLELAAIWKLFGIPPDQAAPFLSIACTVGTLAAMLWWVHRLPALPHRGLVGWMALGLVCSSAAFVVWTSGGGIATRQFTFLLVVAFVALSVHGTRRWGLLTASLSLAVAELTRPEGLMLGACCLGGFAVARMASGRRPRLDWRDLVVMGGPFALVVAGHYLWRYSYYGEWLPNTYYAKYVETWYESGIRYLAHAGIDTGLYLLVPLALGAGIVRWKRCKDGSYAVILLMIVVHMNYLARIGGDHFEYRPLDFYWPLLAVAASEGIVHLGKWFTSRVSMRKRERATCAWALLLFATVLYYAGAIQGALMYEGAQMLNARQGLHFAELNNENAGKWLVAPGMSTLVPISTSLSGKSRAHYVGPRWEVHKFCAQLWLDHWKPYEKMARGTIPDDAVRMEEALGISSYYLPDLTTIDTFGLADATVARNPMTRERDRQLPPYIYNLHVDSCRPSPQLRAYRKQHGPRKLLAHERQPPPGYLKQRGVNFYPRPAARSMEEALRHADYALEVGPNLWMPFNSPDPRWVAKRFAGRNLKSRQSQ